MTNFRETILTALHTVLQTLRATVLRGEVHPERVQANGLLIMRDGEPGGAGGHDWIHPLQRPGLPSPDLVQHGISDPKVSQGIYPW